MYENILKDAQTIKRHLSELGENVDENTICELLESSGPNYEINYIISMLTENWDDDYQNSSHKVRTSIVNNKSSKSKPQHDNEKVPKPEGTQYYTEMLEVSDASSDYDDDRDDYYASTNWDDISVVDTVTRSSPSPLELFDNALLPIRNNEAIPEVEFMEENNNDPNNNLGSVQMLQELRSNNSPEIIYERREQSAESCVQIEEKPESPKPGCSKDPHTHDAFISQKTSPSKYMQRLHAETKQINALLPRFKRNIIYQTLCQNSNAKNRIELTLWDLLSEERPKVQTKRKLVDDTCPIKHARTKRLQCTVKKETEQICKAENSRMEEVFDNAGIDNQSIPDQQSAVSTMEARLSGPDKLDNEVNISVNSEKSVSMDVQKCGNDSVEMQIESRSAEDPGGNCEVNASGTHSAIAQNSILRPPRLKISCNNKGALMPEPVSTTPTPILSPPKFKYVLKSQNQASVRTVDDATSRESVTDEFRVFKQDTDERASISETVGEQSASVAQSPLPIYSVADKIISQNKTPPKVVGEEEETTDNVTLLYSCISSGAKVECVSVSQGDIGGRNRDNGIDKSLIWKATDEQDATPSTSTGISVVNTTKLLLNPQIYNCNKNQGLRLDNQAKVLHEVSKSKAACNFTLIDKEECMSVDLTMDLQDNLAMSNADINFKNVSYKSALMNMPKEQRGQLNNKEITLCQKALNMYYKLIPMFPGVDTIYIKRLCKDYIQNDDIVLDEGALLQNLIEMLLVYGQKYPRVQKIESPPRLETYDLNEQYANLLGIFPEADPVYLRNMAEQMYNDPDQMKQFVQAKLENPDYPTRQEYLAKKKITEQQKQYTTGFQVKQFLEIFPDPFSHFQDDKRKCEFSAHAVDFLKHRFNHIRVNTVLNMYTQQKYNLTLTVKILETLNSDMKHSRKRTPRLVLTENIPFLQECAFIEHKADLEKYLAEMKEKEMKEFEELKAKKGLFECQCCFDDECMPSKCSTCEDGHIFCNLCIARSTDVKLADGETHINCLANCGLEFHLSVLQHVLSPTKFSILLQKRQEAEVMAAGLEGLVSCPFCHFASIPPPEDKVFKCFNPDCMKESCRLCKELNHLPLKCNEIKSDAARLYLEEKMSEALLRKCYRCGKTFFKEEGCNKMTCVCGAEMCYICDEPVRDYKHFRGQGDTASNLCPLWSDNLRINAEGVIKVYNETLKQIKEKNPEIELNANALLPKLPCRTKGPHEDVAHANIIPAHANRVMRQIP